MVREIDVKEWRIKELDDAQATKFEVPRIQRTYAWEKKQVKEFIEDLEHVSKDDYSQHYFGAFCTAEKERNDNVELIIDGQQRIATAHLFLKYTKNKIQDTPLKKQVENIISNSKIVLGKNDHNVFEKIMSETEIDIKEIDKKSKLYKAYQNIKILTDETDVDKLVRTLLWRFRLVKIRLPYKIYKKTFHLVNNRGKDLTQSELIKSHIFMDLETDNETSPAELDKLDGRWTEMSKNIRSQFPSATSIDQFIQYALSIKHGITNLQSMYDDLIREDRLKPSSKTWLLELFKWSDWYMDLLKPPEEFAEPSVSGRLNVKTWLQRIKELKAKNIYPILLAGYNKYFVENNKKDFYKLVDSCYRFHFRVKTLGDISVSSYTEFTQKTANEMYADDLKLDAVIHKLDCYIREGEEKKELKSIIDSISNITAILRARHCLLLIEEYKNGVEKIANRPTVEHVLPQNYTNPDWFSYIKKTYSDENEPKSYINNLGNMVLLSDNNNSEIQDKPLSEKIQKYKESAYKITQELSGTKDWTPSDIEARCNRYAESLKIALDITKYPTCVRNR